MRLELYSIYTIYDRVVGTYGDPFVSINDDDCKRKIAYSMQSNPYKSDLQLFKCGTFDVEQGCINAIDRPLFMCNILDCFSMDGE